MLNKLHKRRGGFTLVEIMIVVAIIALLAAIAVPGFLRARKRSQASRILNDLRMIDAATDQYAIETNRTSGNTVGTADWTNYLKKGSTLYLSGNSILGHHSAGTFGRLCRTVGRRRYWFLVALWSVIEADDSFACHSLAKGVAGNEL
ncbi:MAG: prepilin-type cleavage/methylation domain-containing protein [Verrucomicrobia bacterium]|nr:MAG: prepilin-type cleavage/methylation domain-containing protein [Verrucomicrobiota bacterium]